MDRRKLGRRLGRELGCGTPQTGRFTEERHLNLRRVVSVIVALVALGGAVAFAQSQQSEARDQAMAQGQKLAYDAAVEAERTLLSKAQAVQQAAVAAANLPQMLQMANSPIDAATVREATNNEPWWGPYRDEYPLYAVMLGRDRSWVRGASLSDPVLDQITREIPAGRDLRRLAVIGAKAWLLGAAAIASARTSDGLPAVVVLGKPLDGASLGALMPPGGQALMVTDGHGALGGAGLDSSQHDLMQAIGHETPGLQSATNGRWSAAARAQDHGLYLWVLLDTQEALALALDSAGTRSMVGYGLGALLALLALAAGFWPRPAPAAPRPTVSSPQLTAAHFSPEVAQAMNHAVTQAVTQAMQNAQITGGRPTITSGRMNAVPSSALPMGATGMTPIDPGSMGFAATATALPAIPTVPPMSAARAGVSQAQPAVVPAGVLPENVFGRYVLVDKLGEGGMGAVYIAVAYGAEGFRRTFVVKRLRAELSREPELVDQFIDEARMGSTLVHSNIVPVFDFGKVGDEYFMAQEYILGRDMEKLTSRAMAKWGRALPAPFVFYAAQQVLQALAYAHARLNSEGQPSGLVHRDVSPQNVLVSARGEVKLFDFGIVKSDDRKTQTAAGVVKGNVSFMAPEQARGRALDGRADLFSLGLVMYRCLAGEILYQDPTTYDMLVHAAGGLTEENWAKVRALPEPAATLLRKALSTDPSQRFQTAMEFAAALPSLLPSAAQDAAAVVQALFGDEIKAETTRLHQLDKSSGGA